jgi:hypothetical protein
MRPTLYLDSSVPSYWLVPERDDPIVAARHLITRRWWSQELVRFEVFISQIALDELAGGQPNRARQRLALVKPPTTTPNRDRRRRPKDPLLSRGLLPLARNLSSSLRHLFITLM